VEDLRVIPGKGSRRARGVLIRSPRTIAASETADAAAIARDAQS
jgi:hypothetical protein